MADRKSRSAPPKNQGSDGKLYATIAVIVAGLAALVWWSLPGDHPPIVITEEAGSMDPAPPDAEAKSAAAKAGFDRPPRAASDFAVLASASKSETDIRAMATVTEIAKRLDVRHCGGACDAVKKYMSDEDNFELDVSAADDLILPSKDTLDTVAMGLTPAERDMVHSRPHAVTIRTQGNITPEQLAARTAFAAAAVLAEALDGFVYDEVSRRIETAHEFTSHTIVAPLGQPVFTRKQIVVQLYRQEDGTARILTLGMARYGAPDISIRGANMSAGPLLAEVLNAAAAKIAHGAGGPGDTSITITLDDVAKVTGKKPSDLNPTPSNARPVELGMTEPERIEGDPDNELGELIAKGGSNRENWDAVVASIYGAPTSITSAENDKELTEVTKKARAGLPDAIKRFQAGEGELFLKGPFPIPAESRLDGGATTELLWINAASCDARACTGVLSNEPSYATNLAPGKVTSVQRNEVADWLLQQRDGGTAGGESIKVLKARLPK